MSAVLKPAPHSNDVETISRREKAREAARTMRELILRGDYAAVWKDGRERFGKVLDALAK